MWTFYEGVHRQDMDSPLYDVVTYDLVWTCVWCVQIQELCCLYCRGDGVYVMQKFAIRLKLFGELISVHT